MHQNATKKLHFATIFGNLCKISTKSNTIRHFTLLKYHTNLCFRHKMQFATFLNKNCIFGEKFCNIRQIAPKNSNLRSNWGAFCVANGAAAAPQNACFACVHSGVHSQSTQIVCQVVGFVFFINWFLRQQ